MYFEAFFDGQTSEKIKEKRQFQHEWIELLYLFLLFYEQVRL